MISEGPGALEGTPPSVADHLEAVWEDILAFTPFPRFREDFRPYPTR